jgi:catechol 2,3-dioxygenase-like lactoylglutathione lyase family enzyme
MLSHVILGVSDADRAVAFYDAVLGILGYRRRWVGASGAGYGTHDELGINTFWVTKPVDGRPATAGNGTNVAFVAPSRKAVQTFYEKALSLGGVSEGEPGIREEAHPTFYAAYVRDLDGHKIVAVCHEDE